MTKEFAVCENGIVQDLLYVNTETMEQDYPEELISRFVEIPFGQTGDVKPMWRMDEETGLFLEPELGETVNGRAYTGSLTPDRIYELFQDHEETQGGLLLELARHSVELEEQGQKSAMLLLEIAKLQIALDEAKVAIAELTPQNTQVEETKA